MGSVAGEAAFEQDERAHFERIGGEAARGLEEGRDFAAAAAFPAREGDVGVKRAAFGF
jgi:hypothetical protein